MPVRRRNALLAAALVAVGYVTCALLLRVRMIDLDVSRRRPGSAGRCAALRPGRTVRTAVHLPAVRGDPDGADGPATRGRRVRRLRRCRSWRWPSYERSAPRVLPLHSLVLFVVVLAVACAAFDPARRTLLLGQINLILCAVILLDIARREGRWRGLAVGVAAGIKLTPLFFIAFPCHLQRAAARNLVLGFAGTVLIGFALMPRSSWTYWTQIAGDAERIGPPFRFSNQSINGLLHRSSVVPESWTGPLWLALSVVVGGLILMLAKHFWEHDRAVTAVAMAGIAMTLVSPFSWTHHWVWARSRSGCLLISSERNRFRLDLLAGGFLLVFMVRILWWPPHEEGDEFGWGLASTIFGNAWIIASLVFLALVAARARSSSLTRGG